MRRLVKILVVLAVLAGGGYAAWYYGWREDAPGVDELRRYVPDEEVVVERGNIRRVVSTSGRIIPKQEITIKCKASGEAVELPFDVSDRVKRGDLLMRLDPTDEERSVRRAKVDLEVSKSRLEASKINYEMAKQKVASDTERVNSEIASVEIRFKDKEQDLQRTEQLFSKDLISQEELDKARVAQQQASQDMIAVRVKLRELETSRIALLLRKNEIEISEAQVETDQIKLSDAEQRLADTKVFSPTDGVLSALHIRVGQIVSSGTSSVNAGTDILTITDMSEIYSDVNVDESEIPNIKQGMRAEVTTDAAGTRKFPGKVVRIWPKGSRRGGVVNFVVRVEILEAESPYLKPEMNTNIDIVLDEREDVLRLPRAALRRDKKQYFVNLITGEGVTEVRNVEIGVADSANVEIVSGLEEGDKVLLSLSAAESRWVSQMLDRENMVKWNTTGGGAGGARRR